MTRNNERKGISPGTVIGQCVSVALALIGTVFFGLVVGAATRAVEVTIRNYRDPKAGPPIGSP